jgi:predicted Zn-dependent protease with MMP-like domain/curved DNA-binding protein CbpA
MPELEPDDEKQDYYNVLGLSKEASDEQIRHRYYMLAKKWHPDRFLSATENERLLAERRMKQLTRAYHILGNPDLRLQYDERRGRVLHAINDDAQSWQSMPGMYPSSPVPPGFAAPAPSMIREEDKNGAGLALALLSFLIALGCLIALLSRQLDIVAGSLLLVGCLVFALAGILFWQQDSPFNRAINAWMNTEPKHFRQERRKAEQARKQAEDHADRVQSAFEVLVEEALDDIPDEFQKQMENLAVLVEPEPDEATLERVGVKEGHILLGLYQGAPLTAYGRRRSTEPERITIFQRPIETYCHGDPDRIRDQVRRVALHELAHHFGIEHEEMPIWVK